MKKLITSISILIASVSLAQSIDVNPTGVPDSEFTPEQLITQSLVKGCVSSSVTGINTVVYDTATNGADLTMTSKSYGYFTHTGTNFPFDKGVILSTGLVTGAEGPNDDTGFSGTSDGTNTWIGDADLKEILDARFGDTQDTNNATSLEFNFVPITNEIAFDYIFASEEWNSDTVCYEEDTFQDGFAFIISGPGITPDVNPTTGVPFAHGGKNIALLRENGDGPLILDGSGNTIPVSIGTIYNNSNCTNFTAVNEAFHVDYIGNDNAANTAPVEFNARTIKLTAKSAVQAGQTYKLKLVIADRSDESYDSAVFLSSSSFNLGGASLGNSQVICPGQTTTLTVSGGFSSAATYVWLKDNVAIAGENGNTLVVSDQGSYTVNVIDGSCEDTATVQVSYLPSIVNAANDIILQDDDNDGIMPFDLTVNDFVVTGGNFSNLTVTYYTSQADADSGTNPIANPTVYSNTTNPQVIYVRIQENVNGCYETTSFQLIVVNIHNCFDVIDNQNLSCLGDCIELTASYVPANTASYTVESIAYNPQDPFTGLGNIPNFPNGGFEYNDTPIDLPFTFNYFGNCYSALKISDQGTITFNTDLTSAPYLTTLPDAFEDLNNTIYGLISYGFDTFSAPIDVSYGVFGTGTNRRFVVGYNEIPDTDCPALSYTFQVVLYETTNVIEVFIKNKPNCASSFSPEALVGIQNENGAIAYTAPGINNEAWNGTDIAWRFTPSGDVSTMNYVVNWYDSNNTLLNTGVTYQACPTEVGATTYIVKAEDQNGVGATYSDVVTVTVANTSPVIDDITGNNEICPGIFTTLITDSSDSGISYQWELNNSAISGETNASLTTNQTGVYTVIATNSNGCSTMKTITLTEKTGCFIPTGISPNGDGINDYFDITWLKASNIKMYNRYGTKVYEKDNYRKEWNGQSDNGNELPVGTYYYVLEVQTGNLIKGWVYINIEN